MDIQVEQECPQCGAPVTLHEDDRLLACPFCGVKNFLRSSGTFRYILPSHPDELAGKELIYAPYIRLKSNVFDVSDNGVAVKVIDTTQLGYILPGLPYSLGMRPQAMKLSRLAPENQGRFLRLSLKAKVIQEKAIHLTRLARHENETLLHRAFIGDTISYIYLPLKRGETHLLDGVTNDPLISLDKIASFPLKGTSFNPRWLVHFLPAICPRCGWNLDGEKDCLVPTCSNCDSAWEIGDRGLKRLDWLIQPGGPDTELHLPFWKVKAHLPAQKIYSFADFIERTNQPVVPRSEWRERVMSFLIPAFKMRPKIFLRTARNLTISQWRLQFDEGFVAPNLYPVNLPRSEAVQAIKITLAAAAISPKNILPYLPETRIKDAAVSLAYLPFIDKGLEWLQPQSGVIIAKSVLYFGRKL